MNRKFTFLFSFVFLIGVVLFNSSCKKADINFGEEFLDNNIAQIFKTDSFGANLSTVYVDSFITSSKGTALIGAYADPLFGRITTQTYFELIPPLYVDAYTGTSFDSITLILKPNFNYYGDSTIPVNITIHELADSIYLKENSFYFFNTSKFNVKSIPLFSNDFKIRPLANNEISIRLPDAMGIDYLNKLKNQSDNTLKTAASFLAYFRGFRISTNNTSNMIFGCSDNIVMRLHYKKPNIITEEKYVDFTLANRSHQFNNISIVRTGAIQNISSTNNEIHSSLTNNAAYTQSATGSMIKMSFPTLRDIQKLPNFAKILKATLIIKPIKGSYNTTYFLPPLLRLSTTNANNKIIEDLAYVTSTGNVGVQYGALQTDFFLNENTQYHYDLTQYVKHILETPSVLTSDGLLLSPPSPNFENQFARVIIGNSKNILGKIQLQIYYAAVK